MRKLTIGLLALTLLLPAGLAGAQQKEEIRIAGGRLGGTYRNVYAPNLASQLFGYKALQLTTSGSGENLEMLIGKRADIAFSQADVFAGKLAADPKQYGKLMVVGRLADECLYVAVRTAGPVTSFDQLSAPVAGNPARVAVGNAEGGAAATWQYLSKLVPGLAAAELSEDEGTLALNRLAAGAGDAVLWVTDPANYQHYNLRAVRDNERLDLVPLTDPALVNSLPDGTDVYHAHEVKLTGKWRANKLKTVCTNALVVVRRDADPKLIEKVSNAIGLHLDKIVRRKP